MTDEEFDAWMEQAQALQYDENGVDLSHLRENLKLTPAQRMQKHEASRRFIKELRGAARRQLNRSSSPTA
jgi:hypothetical protein